MFPAFLLIGRYVLGTVALLSGIVLTPLPIPLGIPLILLAITLYAGSTKPARRIAGWIMRRFKRARTGLSARRPSGSEPPRT